MSLESLLLTGSCGKNFSMHGAKFCRMRFAAARGHRYEQGAAGALSAVLSFGPSVGTVGCVGIGLQDYRGLFQSH